MQRGAQTGGRAWLMLGGGGEGRVVVAVAASKAGWWVREAREEREEMHPSASDHRARDRGCQTCSGDAGAGEKGVLKEGERATRRTRGVRGVACAKKREQHHGECMRRWCGGQRTRDKHR